MIADELYVVAEHFVKDSTLGLRINVNARRYSMEFWLGPFSYPFVLERSGYGYCRAPRSGAGFIRYRVYCSGSLCQEDNVTA